MRARHPTPRSNNQLSGTLPPELGQWSTIMDLQLARNQLVGTIPRELFNMRRLRKLILQ
jgi:hypothetical protein